MSFNILIVEDEVIIADDLALSLEQAGYTVVGGVDNAKDATRCLQEHTVDLVLLDIHIKGNEDGIDIAHTIKDEFNIPFIFITSYVDGNTLKKVELVNPSAYIVKPYREEEVLMNVRLALKKRAVQTADVKKQKIFVREGGLLKPIKTEVIVLAKGEDNYTRLVTNEKKEYVVSHTLKSIEEKLPKNLFCRIHKSYIINIDFIELIEGNSIQVSNQSIPIGKTYRSKLFEHMEVL